MSLDPEDKSLDCKFEKLPLASGETRAKNRAAYAREGLKKGLEFQKSKNSNPLQFGLVGATDSHRANPGGVLESKWGGNHGDSDAAVSGRLKRFYNNPGGITAYGQKKTSTAASLQR